MHLSWRRQLAKLLRKAGRALLAPDTHRGTHLALAAASRIVRARLRNHSTRSSPVLCATNCSHVEPPFFQCFRKARLGFIERPGSGFYLSIRRYRHIYGSPKFFLYGTRQVGLDLVLRVLKCDITFAYLDM